MDVQTKTRILLLVWHRLRTLGTFSLDAARHKDKVLDDWFVALWKHWSLNTVYQSIFSPINYTFTDTDQLINTQTPKPTFCSTQGVLRWYLKQLLSCCVFRHFPLTWRQKWQLWGIVFKCPANICISCILNTAKCLRVLMQKISRVSVIHGLN